MADRLTYGQEQAEENLRYWQGLSGKMRKPSLMASPEEKAAYTAQEVRAGNAPEYALPEDYGGMPQGTTRRAIRAREAWGQQQAYIAGLAEQERQQAEYDRKATFDNLRYESEAYDLRTKQNEELFSAKEDADRRAAEAAFTEFRNSLDPNKPESVGVLASYIAKDSRLADNPIAKNSYDYFAKAAENSVVSIANQDREKKAGILNKAREEGVTEDEIDATKFADPKTGAADYNYSEIAKLAAQRAGKRKAEKPEETPEEKRAKATEEEIVDERKWLKSSILNLEDLIAETESNLETFRANSPDRKKVEAKISTLKKQLENRKSQLGALSGEPTPTEDSVPSSIPTIKSPEELNNLPSGAEYIAPNGKKYRKL